ncbi:MAG: hypothetical protein LPH21_08770 [Shewanella sp.]|nr:hypothetical protein [Shewanella sp.]
MANVISQLLGLLKQKEAVQGRVVAVEGSIVRVSTASGIKEVTNGGARNLRAGDTVK